MIQFGRAIDIIGVQMDKGAQRRGVDMGPSAIRYAGLAQALENLGYAVIDGGDILSSMEMGAEGAGHDSPRLNNLAVVNEVNGRLYAKVLESLQEGHFPLVLGGDHSIALGTATAMQQYYGKIGIIWVDAHGDFNNAGSSPSGNIHGMPLSALTGNGPMEILPFKEDGGAFIAPGNAVIIGARDLDEKEKMRIKEAGVHVFTIADIDKYGMLHVAEEAMRLATLDTNGFYFSFDLDAIDPTAAPGVGTPVIGGLTYREAHLLCELIAASKKLLGIEVVELNPILDNKNQTGDVAVEMISSLLCKTII